MSKHIFAIYVTHSLDGSHITVHDQELVRRLTKILRLKESEQIIFFNGSRVAHVYLQVITSKKIEGEVHNSYACKPLQPDITWLLPLMERDQFEHALYSLAAVGINTIVPIVTQGSRASWGQPKDYERAERIFIAACEQSKQFVIPALDKVISLKEYVITQNSKAISLVFDADGKHISQLLPTLDNEKSIYALTGPEAGLSAAELLMLQEHDYTKCALTSSILKASHAAALGSGILRSWLR